MALNFDFTNIEGFEWDQGNLNKNRLKHGVEANECEEIFYNFPLLAHEDIAHSLIEKRFKALGRTNHNRLLFIAFTVRDHKIRIISARDQNRKERIIYLKHIGGENE